jgi:hypothetical protein
MSPNTLTDYFSTPQAFSTAQEKLMFEVGKVLVGILQLQQEQITVLREVLAHQRVPQVNTAIPRRGGR